MKAVWLSLGAAVLLTQAAVAGHLTRNQRVEQNGMNQMPTSQAIAGIRARIAELGAADAQQSPAGRLHEPKGHARVIISFEDKIRKAIQSKWS